MQNSWTSFSEDPLNCSRGGRTGVRPHHVQFPRGRRVPAPPHPTRHWSRRFVCKLRPSPQAGNGTSLAVVSVRICLMTRDAGIFPCVYLPFVSVLRSSYSTPLPVFLWAVCAFSLLNRRRSFYIPGVASLPVMRFAGTSSRPAGCLFSLSRRRLWCARTHGVFLVRAVTE